MKRRGTLSDELRKQGALATLDLVPLFDMKFLCRDLLQGRGSSKSSRPPSHAPDQNVHERIPPSAAISRRLRRTTTCCCRDVWGVVHNGVAATANACDALRQFRAQGGTVVLITNAPRPGEFVQRFIDGLKVPRDSYDAIVSSGDVTRALILERAGERVAHIGPPRDLPIFEGLGASLVPIENADYVVCSGLSRRHEGRSGRLRRRHCGDAQAQAADDLRQSRYRRRARAISWCTAPARSPTAMPPRAAT